MLPGLRSQRPTLLSEVLVHAGDIPLDLGDRLCHLGNPLPERLALRPQLLGSREQLRPAGVRISHHGDRHTLKPAARLGTEQPRCPRTVPPPPPGLIVLAVPGRPIRSLVARTGAPSASAIRDRNP